MDTSLPDGVASVDRQDLTNSPSIPGGGTVKFYELNGVIGVLQRVWSLKFLGSASEHWHLALFHFHSIFHSIFHSTSLCTGNPPSVPDGQDRQDPTNPD